MMAPDRKENITGLLEIRNVFRISKVGAVAGATYWRVSSNEVLW